MAKEFEIHFTYDVVTSREVSFDAKELAKYLKITRKELLRLEDEGVLLDEYETEISEFLEAGESESSVNDERIQEIEFSIEECV